MALFLFDTEIVMVGALPNNQELALALGSKTIVHWSSAVSLTYVGLSVNGSAPIDKMVVCFSNVGNNTFVQTFAHESASATNPVFRFQNTGLADANGGTGAAAVWFQYYAAQSRWKMIGKTS